MGTDREDCRLVLSEFLGKSRPLLVFAPSEDDRRLALERKALADQVAGLADREVVVFESFESGPGRLGEVRVSEADSSAIRRTFRVEAGQFAVVLLGKDGGEKHRWAEPVSAQEIFGEIDAMPMRKREVHERRHGDGRQ